jgi:hypothetical protein
MTILGCSVNHKIHSATELPPSLHKQVPDQRPRPQPTSAGKLEPYYGIPELNSATQGCELDGIPIPCTVITEGNAK